MPKIVDHDQMKKDLLQKSFNIFADKGYSNLSTRQLCKELNCTTGTLYHYFESKEVIFSHMIKSLVETDLIRGIEEVASGSSIVEKLKRLSQFVEKNEKYFIQMLFLVFDCFRQKDGFKNEKKILRQGISSYRETIQKHLGFPFKFSGTFLLAIIIGILVQKIIDPRTIKINELHNESFKLMENEL